MRRIPFNVKLIIVLIVLMIGIYSYFAYITNIVFDNNDAYNIGIIAVENTSDPQHMSIEYKSYCNQYYSKHDIPLWKQLQNERNTIGYDELKCDNISNSNKIIPYRIFQIGFHKIATNSLKEFFSRNSLGSAHYECKHNCSLDSNSKQICNYSPCFRLMLDNFIHSRLLLDGFCHEYIYYGDFGISPMINDVNNPWNIYLEYDIQFDISHKRYKYFWFELLDKQYPCSKFILNIRPLNEWLISRSEHKVKYKRNQYINQYWQLHSFFYFRALKDRNKSNWNIDLTKQEVLKIWTEDWYWYNCYVINYFKSRNRMNDLLIFDVTNDDIQKLIEFFDNKLNAMHWKHTNWKHNHSMGYFESSEMHKLKKICMNTSL
eukprot:260009_1